MAAGRAANRHGVTAADAAPPQPAESFPRRRQRPAAARREGSGTWGSLAFPHGPRAPPKEGSLPPERGPPERYKLLPLRCSAGPQSARCDSPDAPNEWIARSRSSAARAVVRLARRSTIACGRRRHRSPTCAARHDHRRAGAPIEQAVHSDCRPGTCEEFN